MTPDQFWSLHPTELHWLMEGRKPVKMYGNMTEHEVAELYERTYGSGDR